MIHLAALLCATLVSAAVTWIVMRYAISSGLMDTPNQRSSHDRPTARGGGVAIVSTTLLAVALAAIWGTLQAHAAAAICVAGSTVAIIGYLDDRRNLSAVVRMTVHVVAASLFLWILSLDYDLSTVFPQLPSSVALVVIGFGIIWSINLHNFMDGIDGFAGSQGAFVACISAIFVLASGRGDIALLLWASAGANLGFLLWNRPPARIFMGDVGSGFLGFWIAAAALILHLEGALNVWTSVVLSSVFVADATTTLLNRLIRRRRWYEAHRSHAYQHLVRRWKHHGRVTGLLWILNCLIVLPLAGMAKLEPRAAPAIAIGAVVVFAALAGFAKAGQDEKAAEVA